VFVDEYIRIGKTMIYNFSYFTTTVGGTPAGQLRRALPSGVTIAKRATTRIQVLDNNVEKVGFAEAEENATYLQFFVSTLFTNTNWTASTNQTRVQGQITFKTTK